jgi:putative protein-disulfide isomerase
MKSVFLLMLIFNTLTIFLCQCQTSSGSMNNIKIEQPLLCDPASGICELPPLPLQSDSMAIMNSVHHGIKVIYFTDPICSSCWGIEPQLKKLKLEYGEDIEIEYRMGGLLPDWSYNSGGISKPSDVAHHWDEVTHHYDMPIDGDIWLEDPLHSSFPPSIAFKSAQLQDEKRALVFLRLLREMVFLEKKNITKWENIANACRYAGLDEVKLKKDIASGGKAKFEEDLQLVRQYSVRGFPCLFFLKEQVNPVIVYGARPYEAYENAIKQIYPQVEKTNYERSSLFVFNKFASLSINEYAQLMYIDKEQAKNQLEKLYAEAKLQKIKSKNGDLYIGKTVRYE